MYVDMTVTKKSLDSIKRNKELKKRRKRRWKEKNLRQKIEYFFDVVVYYYTHVKM
jgi:hypothetical protein